MEKIDNLETIISLAEEQITESYKINFNLNVEFDIDVVKNSIEDKKELAQNFQNPVCPNNLYINHGTYIHRNKDGIENVINELKTKPDSNRAIISLINQCDIVDSGDKPIPSFMVLQFGIKEKTLYVTAYFRALEVSGFLRINVEEIRSIIEKIVNKLSIDTIVSINLTIVAFKAYNKEQRNPLIKFKLDQLGEAEILTYLIKKDLVDLIEMLEEKKSSSTVIQFESFENILKMLKMQEFDALINKELKKELVKKIIEGIINHLKRIKEMRCKTSHSTSIDDLEREYYDMLDSLIRELKNDS